MISNSTMLWHCISRLGLAPGCAKKFSQSNLFHYLNGKLHVLCICINTWTFCICSLLKISNYIKAIVEQFFVLKKTSFVIFTSKTTDKKKTILRVALLIHTWPKGFHCLMIFTVDECLKHFYWMKMQQIVDHHGYHVYLKCNSLYVNMWFLCVINVWKFVFCFIGCINMSVH